MQDEVQVAVVSPVEGVVTRINLGPGVWVDPTVVVATVEAEGTPMAVQAGLGGYVRRICVRLGEAVASGDPLAMVELADAPAADDTEAPPSLASKCTNCGAPGLAAGFIEERGGGFGRWVEGELEFGLFGGAKAFGRQRRAIEAYRCSECQHLVLFATDIV